jgi:hypothetical protein
VAVTPRIVSKSFDYATARINGPLALFIFKMDEMGHQM